MTTAITFSNAGFSSSFQNLKLSNKRSGYDILPSARLKDHSYTLFSNAVDLSARLEAYLHSLLTQRCNDKRPLGFFTVTDYFVVANCMYFLSLRVRRVVDNYTLKVLASSTTVFFTIFPTCSRLVVWVCHFGKRAALCAMSMRSEQLVISPPCLDLATGQERQLTTGKHAERSKLDFQCPICRSAIGQAS